MRRFALSLVALAVLAVSAPAAHAAEPKLWTVGTVAALQRIGPAPLAGGRTDGDWAIVTDTGSSVLGFYYYQKSATGAANGIFKVVPDSGTGRWLLLAQSGATAVTGLASATPAAVGTAAVGTGTVAARGDHVHAHGAQATGANSHDADQIDFELADLSKLIVQAGSDTIEAAVEDLDGAFGAALSTLTTTSKLIVGAINELDAAIGELEAMLNPAVNGTGAQLVLAEPTGSGTDDFTIECPVLTGRHSITLGDEDYNLSTIKAQANNGDAAYTNVGVLATLTTTDQSSAVNAINEVDANANTAEADAQTGITNAAAAQATADAALPDATYTQAGGVVVGTGAGTYAELLIGASTILGRGPLGAVVALTMGTGLTLSDTQIGIVGAASTTGGAGNATLPLVLDAQGKADGRELSTDGTKLDGIDAGADDIAAEFTAADVVLVGTGVGTFSTLTLTANTVFGKAGAGAVAIDTVTSSTGVGDAGKLLRIDANGSTQSIVTGGGGSIWYKKTITTSVLNDADGDETEVIIDNTGRDFVSDDAFLVLNTECSGGAVNAVTVELGFNDDTDGLVLAENVFTGAGAGRKGDTAAEKGARAPQTAGTALGSGYQMASGGQLVARVLTTAGNTGDLTACSFTAYFHYAIVSGQ